MYFHFIPSFIYVCVRIHDSCVWVPQKVEEDVGCPGVGVMCHLTWCSELHLSPLEE